MDDSHIITTDSGVWTDADDLQASSVEEAEEALGVKVVRFIRLFWLRRRLILGIVVAGILISLVDALSSPNIYTSTTTLLPPDAINPYSSVMNMLSSSSTAASLSSEALGLSDPGAMFISILESRNVQDALVTRYDLLHHYKSRIAEDARKMLAANSMISEDRKTGIITISVRAENPEFARNLAQGYVTELNRVVNDDSTSSARRERVFLEGRLADIKQQLDDSSKALSQFSTKSKAIDLPSQAKSMVDAGLKLQTELIDDRSQLAALRETYSEDNYRVRAVEARIAELQRQVDAMGGAPQESGRTANSNNSAYPTASQLPALGVTYYDLERKVRVDEALWETLTKEYEATKVEEVKQIPTVHVLDVANIPQRKSAPTRWLMMVIGTTLSFLIACLFVVLSNVWKEMDPQEEPKKMVIEVLGALPSLQHRS